MQKILPHNQNLGIDNQSFHHVQKQNVNKVKLRQITSTELGRVLKSTCAQLDQVHIIQGIILSKLIYYKRSYIKEFRISRFLHWSF